MNTKPPWYFILPLACAITTFSVVALADRLASAQPDPACCVDRWNPWWTDRGMWGPGMKKPGQRLRMTRHWTFMHSGIPEEYRGERSPYVQKPKAVQAGGELYRRHCSTCHGPQGMGDGDAAKSLNPSPALLAYMIQMPMAVDEYMLWSISEGGQPFGTDMPAFKGQLSKDDIWKIIAFMRAGFPAAPQND